MAFADSGGLALDRVEAETRAFMVRVYGWMASGLALTGVVAYGLREVRVEPTTLLVVALLELGLVIAISRAARSIPASVATVLFLAYAALNGVLLSFVFLVYTQESIATTFFATAGTFGALSIYGATTQRDLTSIGNLCFMALIGLIIASVVNIFLHSSQLYWITTYAGVLIFVGLTAYDTQKIREMAAGGDERAAIAGALALYLDFVNLFLDLLRIFGKRR